MVKKFGTRVPGPKAKAKTKGKGKRRHDVPVADGVWGPPGYTKSMNMDIIGAFECCEKWARSLHNTECIAKR